MTRHNLTSEGIQSETTDETIQRLEVENERYRTALLHYAEQGCGVAQEALTPSGRAEQLAEREMLQAGMPVVNVDTAGPECTCTLMSGTPPGAVPQHYSGCPRYRFVAEVNVRVYPVCCRRCCVSYMRDGDDDDMLCSRCREED